MSESRSTAMIAGAAIAIGVALGVGYLVGHRAAEPAAPLEAASPVAAPVAVAPATQPAAPAAAPVAPPDREPARPRPASAGTPAGERWHPANTPPATGSEAPIASAPPVETAPAAPPAPREVSYEIPSGTKLALRAVSPVSSQTAQAGDSIAFALAEAVVVDGRTLLPAGARVSGRVTQAVPLKKVGGRASLALAFESVEAGSGDVAIDAAWARLGKSETGKDAATIAGGAAVGTVIGNQAKHNDRGKLIGAILGAAAGTAVAASTPGEKIELAAGAGLEVTLRQPATVTIRE